MKIAVLTSGILPVPAVQGGAVENLIDMYLAYNDQHKLHDITVYSVFHPKVREHAALQSQVNHYRYIDVSSIIAKLRKRLHKAIRGKEFYHYSIEYYFDRAAAHIQHQDYDMVVIENRPGFALKLAKLTPASIVHHLHNDFLNNETPGAKAICASTTRIITVSDYIARRVMTIGTAEGKCTVVHNGIDLQRFSPQCSTQRQRSDFGLADDDFVLIFTGRIIPEKGIDRLVEAMKLLADHPHIKLLVLGSSFYANVSTDNDFTRKLRESARSLHDRIVFTGFVAYEQVPSLLSLADAGVFPSVWEEPLGLTCIEAMAMSLPVITTRSGGIPETVGDYCAVLLDADDQLAAHIAEAVLYLYHHPEKRQAMSKAAATRVRLFSKEAYARNFFNAIAPMQ